MSFAIWPWLIPKDPAAERTARSLAVTQRRSEQSLT